MDFLSAVVRFSFSFFFISDKKCNCLHAGKSTYSILIPPLFPLPGIFHLSFLKPPVPGITGPDEVFSSSLFSSLCCSSSSKPTDFHKKLNSGV